jgi:NTE family protein
MRPMPPPVSLDRRAGAARRRGAAVSVLLAALAGCRTPAPPPLPAIPPAPADDVPPRVALVLGGGGARGFAYVGVIRVLEDARIPVEMIVGSSVGSLVGALYATRGTNSYALERIARDLRREDFFDFAVAPALFGTGLATGERLERFVRAHAPGAVEDLRIPFAAVATDLDTGDAVVLRQGEIAPAVRASCAIPGVFEPVKLRGRLLVDGGVALNLPVRVAREMGADVVIAADVTALAAAAPPPKNFVEVILRAVNIVVHGESDRARKDADVLLAPDVGEVGFIDFDQKDAAIASGEESARAAVPRIRAVIDAWRPRRHAESPRAGTPVALPSRP